MQTENDEGVIENSEEKHVKKAMFYSVIPALLIWAFVMTPIIFIYTTFIEPKEIVGTIVIPEWTVMPAVFSIVGLLLFIWKVLTYKIANKLKE